MSPMKTATQDYVVRRLREECSEYGAAARVARGAKVTPTHISNILDGSRKPGYHTISKLAEYWGMTYAELEQLAKTGGSEPPPHDIYPNRGVVVQALKMYFPEDVVEALANITLSEGAADPSPLWWSETAHSLLRQYQADPDAFRACHRVA